MAVGKRLIPKLRAGHRQLPMVIVGDSLYEWVNDIPLNGYQGGEEVNYVEFQIFNAKGKRTYYNRWMTDLEVNEGNVSELVKGARARWKIENEGFNTLKNHGYHLELGLRAWAQESLRGVLCAEPARVLRAPDS